MDAREWIDRFAAAVGTQPPTAEEIEELLGLAGIAAHASERIAAPISCWVAARAGVEPQAALAAARRLAEEVDGDG